jgi:hypothetical protein
MINVITKIKLKKYYFSFNVLVSIFFLVLIASDAGASKFVKIATIGGRPAIALDQSNQIFVDQIITFWKGRINQVLPDKPDLIVLPEVCDIPTGLKSEKWREYLKVRNTQVIDMFSSIAKANHCYIAFGSKRLDEKGEIRNSGILLDREGKIAGIYDKNFPTIGEVNNGVKPGVEAPVFQCDFGRVAFAICFDLNFKELLAKYEKEKPDIILFPSAYHGGLMQSLWAYWCRSFFVGSIGGGKTPSEIRNPLGEVVASSTNYFDYAVATINLDSRVVHLGYNFGKLAALKKKYGSSVTITDPGRLGPVLVSSESSGNNIDRIIKEFDIELIDPYFDRSREIRAESLHK